MCVCVCVYVCVCMCVCMCVITIVKDRCAKGLRTEGEEMGEKRGEHIQKEERRVHKEGES